jgi:hypothetical protein
MFETRHSTKSRTPTLQGCGPVDVRHIGPEVELEATWFVVDPVEEAFHVLVRADRESRRTEAARAEALVVAYDLAVEDAAARFRSTRSRGGPIARSFLKQAASALKMTEGAVGHVLDTTVEATAMMPSTWSVFADGDAPWRAIDIAVRETVGIPEDRMLEWDVAVARIVRTCHASRLKDRLRRARERMLIDTAATRKRHAGANRRVVLEPAADGMADTLIHGPAPEWTAIDHALTQSAVLAKGKDGEDRSIGQLRHDILLDIITEGLKTNALPDPATKVQQRKGVAVQLILTVPALTLLAHGTAPATIEGYGPIDVETARRLAADAPTFTRVLTDPVSGVRLDMDRAMYRAPADLKRWVRLRDQECRDPGCRGPAHRTDIDHVQEWQHEGGTAAVNLVSVCRAMHLLKSKGLWQEHLEPDGTVTWISPWGHTMHDPPLERGDPAPAFLLEPAAEDDCPF